MLKRIFVIGSILFLSFMIVFYGYRLFYYYNAEHKKEIVVTLSNQIITNSEKLIEIDNSFYFPGTAKNNYLYYSGIMYRIIQFNDESFMLIANEDLTKLRYGLNGDYDSSDIKIWLENEYLKNLNQDLLYEKDIKLLDLKTYVNIGKDSNFIKSNNMWILDGQKGLMLDQDGNINTPNSYQYFLGVRPVIKIKNVNYISGNGTESNPYLVENRVVNTLENTYVGEYLKYKDNIYRIISKDNGIKVMSIDSIGKYKFSDSNILYGPDSKDNLYHYLNGEFLSKFDQDELVLTTWKTGTYHASYVDTNSQLVSSYVGLLTIGDYFIQNITGYILLNSDDMIYTIHEDKNLYMVKPSNVLDIYPSFSLKSELIVSGGFGTKEKPYEVGV